MQSTRSQAFELLTGDDEGRVCKDIPESACRHQAGNVLRHVLSLGATKAGDGLADPKIVLAWLFTAIGAPVYLIGLLVPVREAGALLPQLFIARAVRNQPLRKYFWATGAMVQGLAVAGMGLTALSLEGATAGWLIVALLILFSLARSICSVSYKDVLGKTVSRSLRGRTTGAATTLAAAVVLLFGLALSFDVIAATPQNLAAVLFLAALSWCFAAAVFVSLPEEQGATEGGANALSVAREQILLLREDAQLVRFIITRCLLLAVALAPPYLLALQASFISQGTGRLGPLVLAGALAALLSSYAWGRLADRSSRRVLMYAAMTGGSTLLLAAVVAWLAPGLLQQGLLPALLFLLLISYQGIRLGRSVHIVDMATPDTRAAYTALSNTLVGVCLLLAGSIGMVAALLGPVAALVMLATLAFAGVRVASGLNEVQEDPVALPDIRRVH